MTRLDLVRLLLRLSFNQFIAHHAGAMLTRMATSAAQILEDPSTPTAKTLVGAMDELSTETATVQTVTVFLFLFLFQTNDIAMLAFFSRTLLSRRL